MNLSPENLKLINVAMAAALKAGEAIMKVYVTAFDVEIKDDNSPLTLADRSANDIILEMLRETNLPVMSEEGAAVPYSERKNWKRFWMVDPLDGTKEFVKRNGEFTVNIALIEDGLALAGVIYAPAKNLFYVGWQGAGAWRLTNASFDDNYTFYPLPQKAEKLPCISRVGSFHIVGSRSHMSPETTAFIEQMKAEYGVVELLSMGSSLKICLVAEGSADVYPRFAPTMEWDIAAGHAIAKAAGFELLDHFTGEEMRYNRENLLNNWFIVQ
jgi:3'(2'), 5'-bisphosphate nucleotidase